MPDPVPPLTIALEGHGAEPVDFAVFARFCETTRDCLRRCERAVAGEETADRRYPLLDLKIGSALATFGELRTADDASAVDL